MCSDEKQFELVKQFCSLEMTTPDAYLSSVEELLNQGLDPNGVTEYGEQLLSNKVFNTFYDEPQETQHVLSLVKMFVSHGYDVHRDGDGYGSELLAQFSFLHCYDDKLVELVDYVLQLGADPTVSNGEESALSWLACTSSDGSVLGDYVSGSIGELLWRICYRSSKKLPYQGIRTYFDYLGKTVVDAKLVFFKEQFLEKFKVIDQTNLLEAIKYGELLLFVEGESAPFALCAAQNPLIDPYWDQYSCSEQKYFADLHVVDEWLGAKLEMINFGENSEPTFNGLKIHFSNGYVLHACV